MNNQSQIIQWATDFFVSKGYTLQNPPIILIATPWSNVIQFSTSNGDYYLKQTPPTLFLEAEILQIMADQFHANVPVVIAINNDLHCILMKDAGQTLREYLKSNFQPELMCQAIKQFTTLQRSTENKVETFLALGAPDWRLDKLPKLYENIINQTELLKEDGVTDKELQVLHDLRPKLSQQCEQLAEFNIPETLVQTDFNTNNILIDTKTNKLTSIDLGEIVIAHPFLSLINFLSKAIELHGVHELDQNYIKLQEACLENWLDLATKDQLSEAFILTKPLWHIYSTLGAYQLMNSVDVQAFKTFYANRPSRFKWHFKEYIRSVIYNTS